MNKEYDFHSQGVLFGVGLGPGDPALLTLKAVRVIGSAPVIAVPCATSDGASYALQIARDLLRPEQTVITLHFPMVRNLAVRMQHRQRAAETIAAHLAQGQSVAFLTEGDPLIYSTFAHVLGYMPNSTPVEIVPGVSSIQAAAAQAHLPLVQADQRLAILPATITNLQQLSVIASLFDAVILLKLHRTFEQALQTLDALGLTDRAVLVDRASHPLGRVVRDIRLLRRDEVHYLSLLIVPTESEAQDAD